MNQILADALKAAEPLGGEALDYAITELEANKSTILGALDTGINGLENQVATGFTTFLKSKGGIFALFGSSLGMAVTSELQGLVTSGEASASTLFDKGIAYLEGFSKTLGG